MTIAERHSKAKTPTRRPARRLRRRRRQHHRQHDQPAQQEPAAELPARQHPGQGQPQQQRSDHGHRGAGFVLPLKHQAGTPATLSDARHIIIQDLTDARLNALAAQRLKELNTKAQIEILDPALSAALALPHAPITKQQ